jgi:hypothetical protein
VARFGWFPTTAYHLLIGHYPNKEDDMNFFWSKDRLPKPGLRRGICFIIFALAFILTEMGRRIYRPYVYRTGINDLGLADMMGNLGGTVVQIYLYLGLVNATPIQGFRIIAFVAAGYTLYEIVQPILPRGTFDPKDIAATLIANVFSAVLFAALAVLFPEPKPSAD